MLYSSVNHGFVDLHYCDRNNVCYTDTSDSHMLHSCHKYDFVGYVTMSATLLVTLTAKCYTAVKTMILCAYVTMTAH